MNLIIYLITGALFGSIAGRVMGTNSRLGFLADTIVGAVGAFLAGYFISPLLQLGTINDTLTIPTLLITLLGSIAMIWIVETVHHHKVDNRPV